MIERTYRCDMCRDGHELSELIQVEWKGGESRDVLKVASPIVQSERHLCRNCIADIAAIAIAVAKGETSG
jgi:hypothetical protein